MTDITNGPARDAAELQDNFTTKRKRMSPAFWLAVAWISVLLVIAILAPLLPLHDPIRQDYRSLNSGPTSTYWLGTDHLGRDLLSRVLNGARISLSVATTAPFIGMFIGLVLGVSAGFFRGRVDNVVSVVIDSILAFPNIVLAIAFLFYAGNTLPNLILVIAFYTIPQCLFPRKSEPGFPSRSEPPLDYVSWLMLASRH